MCADGQEVAKFANIKAMPTFIAWKKGEKIGDLTGAVPAKLVVSVRRTSSRPSPTSSPHPHEATPDL